ncbi:hypothetical protein BN129_2774 [Cronobacter sakazakii 701]|nr:hypothetical protein BN129_2774 [Cronobacter sakazakii 701]
MKIYALVKSVVGFFHSFLFDHFLLRTVAGDLVDRAFFFTKARPPDWRIKQQM